MSAHLAQFQKTTTFPLIGWFFVSALKPPVLVFRDRSLIAGGWAAFVLERLF
jgi:hypothetical protein